MICGKGERRCTECTSSENLPQSVKKRLRGGFGWGFYRLSVLSPIVGFAAAFPEGGSKLCYRRFSSLGIRMTVEFTHYVVDFLAADKFVGG